MDFIRTVALNVWDLYKEERIAKLMNVSRRKIRKYTELVVKSGFMHWIWPYVNDSETELSRHVKLYFSDLAYYSCALGVAYSHWASKQWALENFVLLELEHKLYNTHEIRFYRKKSGAEITFILVNKANGLLTPIEVTTNESSVIPQSLKTFDTSYNNLVEYYMILNDWSIWQKELWWKSVIILPHWGI
jgi:predicted AAA+ superfamily ATPase